MSAPSEEAIDPESATPSERSARAITQGEGPVKTVGRLFLALRALITVAIFATAALVVDYQNPGDPAFCGVESACHKVRISDEGRWVAELLDGVMPGLKLPELSLLIFVLMLAWTFFVRPHALRRRKTVPLGRVPKKNFLSHPALLAAALSVGGIAAGYFISAQVRMGSYCKYCMLVDVSTILGAGVAWWLALRAEKIDHPGELPESSHVPRVDDSLTVTLFGVGVSAITVMPFLWGQFPDNPALPGALSALAEPGKTTIVSFTDFECPYCRKLHPTIHGLESQPDVVVIRKMVPLAGHRGALPSALAFKCTPKEHQSAVASAFYEAPPEELTYEGVVALATSAGHPDGAELGRCMSLPETRALIAEDERLFHDELGGQGVPMTWVGPTLVKGAQDQKVLSSYRRDRGTSVALPVWAMWVAAGASLAAIIVASDRGRKTPS